MFQTAVKSVQGYINSQPLVWDLDKRHAITPADFQADPVPGNRNADIGTAYGNNRNLIIIIIIVIEIQKLTNEAESSRSYKRTHMTTLPK